MAKVMVAMSGGVDSSVVAALLHEQGHAVTGVTMHLWEGDNGSLVESQCCSMEMVAGARRVCNQLGIPYYVFNYQREFRRNVIEYFLDAYAHGYTPNPCLACNRDLKFRFLLERAHALGFDYLATGHYARIEEIPDAGDRSSYTLLRGVDYTKDQSYVLYMLGQSELAQLMFPLGRFTKAQVRDQARSYGLATADRPESQDICFIPDNNYRRFLQAETPESIRPGPIFDQEGRHIGRHQGLPLYTVGQRKGLSLSSPQPLFVTAIDVEQNALIVGPADSVLRDSFVVENVGFVSGDWPEQSFDCLIQVRARAKAVEACVTPIDDQRLQVRFAQPQRAITPGQAAVMYVGDQVLGGGPISRG